MRNIDIEKLIDAAVDLRIAYLRAKEQGIISFNNEQFQIHNDSRMKELAKDKEYSITKFSDDYKYEYTVTISGLEFFCITNELLFTGDENRIKEFRCEECGKYFIESDLTEENICRNCEEEMWQYGNK